MVQVYIAEKNITFNSFDPWGVLCDVEKKRADRFKFERDKQNFIVAHAVKRIILSKHLHSQPSSLKFEHSPMGKPNLVGFPLHFNLSHSHGLVALSVSECNPVGVDIEVMRDNVDAKGLAARFFALAESKAIKGDRELFYRHWVAKEAILKAEGEGIAENLAGVVLKAAADGVLGIVSLPPHFSERRNWCLHEFIPAKNARAAVALPVGAEGVDIINLNFL